MTEQAAPTAPPPKVPPPTEIRISAPGIDTILKTVLILYGLTQPNPLDKVMVLLEDISRDVKNAYNFFMAALAQYDLATQQQRLRDCMRNVQIELAKEFGSDVPGRSTVSKVLLKTEFDTLSDCVSRSRTAIGILLETYEGLQDNTQQALTVYIGGYCARIAQYLSNLGMAFQIYRMYLDDNETHWGKLDAKDQELSWTYSERQKSLNVDLKELCDKTVPACYPNCYRSIFEKKEFYLFGQDNAIFLDDYKSKGRFTATGSWSYGQKSSAKFKAILHKASELPDSFQNLSSRKGFVPVEWAWTLMINERPAYVLENPGGKYVPPPDSHGPQYKREPLWISCELSTQKYEFFRLEHTRRGLRVSSNLHPDVDPFLYMSATNALYGKNSWATITWLASKLEGESDWAFWKTTLKLFGQSEDSYDSGGGTIE